QSGASQLTRTANLLFSTNTWTHVVFTRNGTVGTFYINGAPVSSYFNQDSIIDPASSASYTLNLFNGPNNYYAINGVLDDVRAYNRALSAKEVLMLYNMGK
ncbi:MAG: LamG domain-containing protein, partial [Patescibacteria group bacterium]|nr:LamG domain-containing protein [Patescibacteria group bacterium]